MKSTTRMMGIMLMMSLPLWINSCGAPHLKLRSGYVYNTAITVAMTPVTNINPITSYSQSNHLYDEMVFETLTGLSPSGHPVPELASTWRHNKRDTLWVLHLNPFAKWWTGRPVTARDVVWSLLERIHTGVPASAAVLYPFQAFAMG